MPTKFQSRHHEVIAQVLRDIPLHSRPGTNAEKVTVYVLQQVVGRLAVMLSEDNEKFDRERFITKCGWGKPTTLG